MAESATVGILKVLLTANAAEFETGLKKAGDSTKKLSNEMASMGQASQVAGKLLSALGVGLSVAGVVAFGKELLNAADATVKLSDKTGISIEALQRMQFIAEQSGNSIDQVANAVSMLQKRIAGGDDAAVNAISALGIELKNFVALNPDEQFLAIAREVAKIEDPMQRAKVATELFGRAGAELLPTLIANVDDLAAKAPVMSERATKAFDAIGDAIARTWTLSKNLAGEGIGAVIDSISRLSQALGEVASGNLSRANLILLDQAEITLPKVKSGLDQIVTSTNATSMSFADMDAISKELTKTVEHKIKATKDDAEASKRAADAQKQFRDSVHATTPVLTAFFTTLSTGMADSSVEIARVREEMALLTSRALPEAAAASAEAEREVLEWARANGAVLAPSLKAVSTALEDVTEDTGIFTGLLEDLGATIVRAFEGGGNVLRSIGGTIGKKIGENFVTEFGSTITKKLGDTFGDLLNSLLPGVGALLGPLLEKVGGFFQGLFGGISPQVKEARQEVDAFQATLAETLTTTQRAEAGGERWKMTVIAVRDAYLATGRTAAEAERIVKQLWDTDHPERAKAAIVEINKVLAEQQTILQGNEQELADLHAQMVALTEESKTDWKDLQEAAERYGVDLAGLGPSFQSARLHDAARQIYDDFILLTRGGADVGAVLMGMQDEIQTLVRDSMAFGVAIPENFKPLIQNLIDAGLLVDANGDKLTDLAGLEFGDPIVARLDEVAASLKTIADRIAELVAKITGPLLGAIDAVPRQIPIQFVGEFIAPDISGFDVPHLASGGIVTQPTLAMIGEAGPEAVVPLSAAGNALGGGLNEEQLSRRLGKHLDRVLSRYDMTMRIMFRDAMRGAL